MWLIFAMGLAWCVLSPYKVIAFVQSVFKIKPSQPTEVKQDFSSWEELAAQGRKYKAQQHKDWLEEAWAILRRDCEHVYHHQHWYTCKKCGYEEPWKWEPNCSCTVAADKALTDPVERYSLITRQSYCKVHGTDYKLFPLSDRKEGPFGSIPSFDSRQARERSIERFGHYVKKIDFPTE